MQNYDESDPRFHPIMRPFAFDIQSGIGRHSHVAHIEAKLRYSDYQHIQFMIYRRRVIETWPESATKMALLAAIKSSIASLVETEAKCSAILNSPQPANSPHTAMVLVYRGEVVC